MSRKRKNYPETHFKLPIVIEIPLEPRTKKNSQEIGWRWVTDKITGRKKKVPYIRNGKVFLQYQNDAGYFLKYKYQYINQPINIRANYYMSKDYSSTGQEIDITNLNSALHDVLVHYGVIAGDHSRIVIGTDGSRVLHDPEKPRTVLYIDKPLAWAVQGV